jgi:hypothetical protein
VTGDPGDACHATDLTELSATILDAKTEVDVRDYGAVLNGIADDTSAIQAALNTGQNLVIGGKPGIRAVARTMATLTMRTRSRGQTLTTKNAVIQPAFVGDVVRMNQVFQHVRVHTEGNLQPATGDYSDVAAIAIGRGGSNPKCASVAYSTVQSFKESGIIWEHGAHIDFTQFYADTVSHYGIRCDGIKYDDNNHGLFNNCQISKAGGRGYAVLSSTSQVTDNKSRSHQFINTKAFQCGQNYRVESINNVGTVFSELGITPDEYTATSKGNYLQVIDDQNAFENWIDSGTGNVLEGYSRFGKWEVKRSFVRTVEINNLMSGSQEFSQDVNYSLTDAITRTNVNAVVTHKHGGTGLRTDVFSGRVQLAGATAPAIIVNTVVERYTFPANTVIAAGATLPVTTTATGIGGAHIALPP